LSKDVPTWGREKAGVQNGKSWCAVSSSEDHWPGKREREGGQKGA